MKRKERTPRMSISTRLFLWIMALVMLFVAGVIILDSRIINAVNYIASVWNVWDLGGEFNDLYDNNELDDLEKLYSLENTYGVPIEIFDDNGYLIYTSESNGDVYGLDTDQSLAKNYEVIASGRDIDIGLNRYFEIQRDTTYNTEYMVYGIRLANGYEIKAYKNKSPVDEGTQFAVQFIVFTTIGLIFVAAIVIRIFSKRFMKPLKNISEITRDMSNLDFSKRCPPSNTREIAVLSDSINEMSESLNVALEDLKQKNQKLQEDYDKEVKLERLRTDFIAGASHELKTPIAIIRGYAEGMTYLLDTDPEAAKQYVNTIVGETERMNGLVMRLLEIIKYDSGDYIINNDVFNIRELVQDWFTRNAELLSEKGITYENLIDTDCMGEGDSMLISSVVNNYLSNGVSHAEGEKLLRATVEERECVYRVSIFNTGRQIDEKDIDLIWNSFYRADKSMTRAEGRFGLGLATVASIQRLHGVEFGVVNEPEGVRFWFDIKKTEIK